MLAYANPTAGGSQEMLCIPLKLYLGWVYSINAAKVPDPAVRQRVELYQLASSEALYQFWLTGSATVETVAAVMCAALEPTIPPRSTRLLRAMAGVARRVSSRQEYTAC